MLAIDRINNSMYRYHNATFFNRRGVYLQTEVLNEINTYFNHKLTYDKINIKLYCIINAKL